MSKALFANRTTAGKELAKLLQHHCDSSCVVYGLPTGGVLTARAIADELNAPLDVLCPRKLRHPVQHEYAIGAVTEDGFVMLSDAAAKVSTTYLVHEEKVRLLEAQQRREHFKKGRPPVPVEGRIAIVVDDGIATGFTLRAAIESLRQRNPASIVVAAPVAPARAVEEFRNAADEVVVAHVPSNFCAIGAYYEDFDPVSEDDVIRCLR